MINVEGGLKGPRKERMSDQASNGNDGTAEDGRMQRRARYQSINTEPTGTDDVRRERRRAGLHCDSDSAKRLTNGQNEGKEEKKGSKGEDTERRAKQAMGSRISWNGEE